MVSYHQLTLSSQVRASISLETMMSIDDKMQNETAWFLVLMKQNDHPYDSVVDSKMNNVHISKAM